MIMFCLKAESLSWAIRELCGMKFAKKFRCNFVHFYFPDLPLVSNTNILSPYSSSGSQGNMSASPMSTSSSPQHLADYITLNDDTYRYEGIFVHQIY